MQCRISFSKRRSKGRIITGKRTTNLWSTFHAAGLVGQLRGSANITQVLKNSVDLYRKIELETGQETGWKMNGGMRLPVQMIAGRTKTAGHHCTQLGLDMELLVRRKQKNFGH
ncbi:MAG: hypothetical protein CM1200mP30_25050 [Pseudomonadota bacterium]|nr:MAG: hypothetical protein CM1200mP30_25050 [Pseudomonadota bacterium]